MGTRGRPRHASEENALPEPAAPEQAAPGQAVSGQAVSADASRAGRGRAERRRTAQRAKRRRQRSLVREVPLVIGVALAITLLLQTFLVQVFSIPSGSMQNTIAIGDRVAVDKLSPWLGWTPQRGDVVVFNDPSDWLRNDPVPSSGPVLGAVKSTFTFLGLLPSDRDLIKRVIGLPGDTVACCGADGKITVNGHEIDEPYLYAGNAPSRIPFKVTVPAGELWVMGDHRDISADSRYHMSEPGGGFVPEKDVVGRAVAIVWPISRWQTLPGGQQSVRQVSSAGPLHPVPAELPIVMGVVAAAPGVGRLRRGRRG
ncbi:signal peptidase I, partial [Streptacidiphilus jiangxiensis]|uniref:Signal peptidase I n=1 Tax=Streptacidiphilus jiangxiensis TaxID=235985 RepID=A0A1H7XX57_STRJI|nr:signal peptidase I [Streptacidiphilus jiangxiensis]